MNHVKSSHATQNSITQRFDHVAAFDQGFHEHAIGGTAIVFGDHQILGHIDQTPGQITRVGSFQRGIGQALTRAVGRNEVLQNIEAFTEVSRDWRLDDRAVRFRHQAAHTGKLTNLSGGTARTGVGHHVDRVERFLLDGITFPINRLLGGQLVHHGLGNLVTGLTPDIHHLVVTLAIGHQTRGVLRLDFLHLIFGGGQDGLF